MSVRINFVNQLPDNIITYEDFYVKYIDNYVDLMLEPWYGGYLNSLYAAFPPCDDYWDRWYYEPFNHEDYLTDNPIKKGGLQI